MLHECGSRRTLCAITRWTTRSIKGFVLTHEPKGKEKPTHVHVRLRNVHRRTRGVYIWFWNRKSKRIPI